LIGGALGNAVGEIQSGMARNCLEIVIGSRLEKIVMDSSKLD